MDLQFGVITAQHFDQDVKAVPGLTSWTFGLHGTSRSGRTAAWCRPSASRRAGDDC